MKKGYRRHDEEFKRELIARIDGGQITKTQAAREYNLALTLIDRWQRQIHDGSMRHRPYPREKQLERHGARISMSRKGNPYDNAFAESFMKTLKTEDVCLWEYESFTDVVERVREFIEAVYNRKRVHSGIGSLPPEEFEAILQTGNGNNQLGQRTLKMAD